MDLSRSASDRNVTTDIGLNHIIPGASHDDLTPVHDDEIIGQFAGKRQLCRGIEVGNRHRIGTVSLALGRAAAFNDGEHLVQQ